MKKQAGTGTNTERREFIRGGAAAGVGAAALAALPGRAVAEAAQTDDTGGEKARGYRLTEHVVAYYRSAAR